MVNAEFGVIFFSLGLTASWKIQKHWNRNRWHVTLTGKQVQSPWGGHFNVTGANVVFAWQTGYPYALDFSQGYPQYNPGEFTAVDLLKRGDTDATLVISADPGAHFPKPAVQSMMKHPLITINPDWNAISRLGDVVFPTRGAA